MLRRFALALVPGFVLAAAGAAAQPGPDPGPPRPLDPGDRAAVPTSTVMNPAISAIGWFQAAAGNDPGLADQAFELREIELGFQSQVDPFTRADFFLAAGAEGLEVEEGTITWLALPGSGQARIGRFRAEVGKFNRTHPPETPFADRPLAALAFLGEEGLATTGVALSALLPNPLDLYWSVGAAAGVPPDSSESPLFQPESRRDLLGLARTSLFVPLGEGADVNLGASYANALARPELRGDGNRAQLGVADVTFRWKNLRRAYRSFLAQAELIVQRGSAAAAPRRAGGFAYAIYRFARQWRVGARFDRTDLPGAEGSERGALALVSYQPSEFSTISLQGRRVRDVDGEDRDAAFFKWTFSIGPHGGHPY